MSRLAGRARALWGPFATSDPPMPPGARVTVTVLLVLAFALRFAVAWRLPNIHQADEIYQAAEQASRAVNGYGIVSWEFQTASRPALLAALVLPIYRVTASPHAHQMLQAALFCALSLIPVWVAFHWASRLYGITAGVLASGLMAMWFELVYFAPKATADLVGAYFFLPAVLLGRPQSSPGARVMAGLCLALALGIRMQIAPAIAIVAVCLLVAHGPRRAVPLAAGFAAGLAIVGAIEWIWWGAPFRGHWGYLEAEFVHGASRYFGRQPVTFYLKTYTLMYGGLLPVLAFLIVAGAKDAPILLLAAIALILPFHAIGHKEYRFIVVATPVLVLLAGLGGARLMMRFSPRPRRTATLLLGGAAVAMLAISLGDTYRDNWYRDGNHIRAFADVGRQEDACGLALLGILWPHTPGYSGLGRNVSIYPLARDEAPSTVAAQANYILAAPKAPPPGPPYAAWKAYDRPLEIVYRRPGGCVPDPARRIEYPPSIPGTRE